MGYLYNADQVLGVALNISVPKPLDVRTVVGSEKDLYNISPSSAYKGMTVANTEDGNVYMLIDKDNITNKLGWKASSSTNIITCTYDEYQKWSENTKDDFTPEDITKEYLNPDSYYYIIEDDQLKGRYLTQEWGDAVYTILNSKVDNSAITSVRKELIILSQLLSTDYITSSEISTIYAKIADIYNRQEIDDRLIEIDSKQTGLSTEIQTIKEQLPTFVTKDQLGEDFNFVTETEYVDFKKSISENFESDTITTSNLVIQQSDEQSSGLSMGNDGLLLDGEKIALFKDVPNIVCLTEETYKNLEKKEDDTYYFTYNENFENGYVDNNTLSQQYYTKSQVDLLIQNKIKELQESIIAELKARIEVLESYHAKESFILDESTLDETQIG